MDSTGIDEPIYPSVTWSKEDGRSPSEVNVSFPFGLGAEVVIEPEEVKGTIIGLHVDEQGNKCATVRYLDRRQQFHEHYCLFENLRKANAPSSS